MVYLKENSTIKDKFFEKILTQKSEKHFLAPNGGGRGGGGRRLIHGIDLYTGKYGTLLLLLLLLLLLFIIYFY